MTSTHGIILAAIGLAMFAILAVVYGRKPFAWYRLWRQQRAKRLADLDAARQEFADACDVYGVSRFAAAFSLGVGELSDPDKLRHYAQRMREAAQPKPNPDAPYASPIAGTGSRPEAPWVTREELDAAEQRVNDGLDDLAARLDALESTRAGDGLRVFVNNEWTADSQVHCRYVVVAEDVAWVFFDDTGAWAKDGRMWSEFSDATRRFTELNGPERAVIVRAFREWRKSQ